MTHKHLVLDWDGVIDASWYHASDGVEASRRLHIYPTAHEGVQVLVDPLVVAKIREWASRDDVTVHWLSARGFWVYTVLAPAADLDGFAWLPTASDEPGQAGWPYEGHYSLDWWKTVAVREFLGLNDDLVMWVDDSISGALRHHINSFEPERLSMLVPDKREGLQAQDVDIIDRWINDELPTRYVTDLYGHGVRELRWMLEDAADGEVWTTDDLLDRLGRVLDDRYGRRARV